jgi:hypothetical protein
MMQAAAESMGFGGGLLLWPMAADRRSVAKIGSAERRNPWRVHTEFIRIFGGIARFLLHAQLDRLEAQSNRIGLSPYLRSASNGRPLLTIRRNICRRH